jgi:hypothetical protein
MYYASGYAGQLVLNIPALQMTIVTASDANFDWDEAGENFDQLAEFIINSLLVPLKNHSATE